MKNKRHILKKTACGFSRGEILSGTSLLTMPVKGALFLLLLLAPLLAPAQVVTVDDSTYTASDLANTLFNTNCINLSDISSSSGQSVAFFNNNGGAFPFDEGVVILSGKAKYAAGPYTGEHISTQVNTNTDSYLQEISSEAGQGDITDVAYLEFKFVPMSNRLSFNFIFASNEYGQWQCYSSDAFAFLLTNMNTGETTNLGVIPNTDLSVSVANIHDEAYNEGCDSQHPELFDVYNVNNPNSTINMRGYTVSLTASSAIQPGVPYRLRLVIGDSNDPDYDSAVFIEGGSFRSSVDLGEDRPLCEGDSLTLNTHLDPIQYNHVWTSDGEILPDEHGATLTVTGPGTYGVEVTKNGSDCSVSDEITITPLEVTPPQDLNVCGVGDDLHTYNLNQNDAGALGLDSTVFETRFYASEEDLENHNPIPENELAHYAGSDGMTIYVKIYDVQTGLFCDSQYSFNLLTTPDVEAFDPGTIDVCFDGSGYQVDFTQLEGDMIGEQTGGFSVTYYTNQADAINHTDSIADPTSHFLEAGFSEETFWARVQRGGEDGCFAVVSFQVREHPVPPVSHLSDTIVCSQFILPDIPDGDYFSGSHGHGEAYDPGDTIFDIGTYYIYNENDWCNDQTDFLVFVVDSFDVTGTYCGSFEVPEVPVGAFYTAPDGPDGDGELIPAGTEISSAQTIYYYAKMVNAEGDSIICKNDPMPIDIAATPSVGPFSDVMVCDHYTLPPLDTGNYFSSSNGNGTEYAPGDQIDSAMTMYVYADNGYCTAQDDFNIYFVPDFPDTTVCGSYTLPDLPFGGFYTQPMGQGPEIPSGTTLTSSQNVYFYVETADSSNCVDNLSFHITVNHIPPVDSLATVQLCQGDFYVLPPLQNGQYFTESQRQGEQLFPGDTIWHTQQVFINNPGDACVGESMFTVHIHPLPPVSNYTDVYSCGSFVYNLPAPDHGKVYTQPNGEGELVQPGDTISATQVLYIYNQRDSVPYCANQESFTVHVFDVDVGDFDDVVACDNYVLKQLPEGNYYTEPDGEGEELHVGDVIDSSQTLYVYEMAEGRFPCSDQASFSITITHTPELPYFGDVVHCSGYTLPALDSTNYKVGYYRASGGQSKIQEDDYTFKEPGLYTVYVYATAFDNPDCFAQKKFTVEIEPIRKMEIADASICVDPETGQLLSSAYLHSGVDTTYYKVEWYYNENLVHTGPDFQTNQTGQYVVKATSRDPEDPNHCDYKPTVVTVTKSSAPVATAYTTQDFVDVASIYVHVVEGSGEYLFSLDGGPFQPDHVFHDVESGVHYITVKDLNGSCGIDIVPVLVLKYPKFFTPNNDGINDRWNIKDLAGHPEARIYIFDRYGKLLKQISPSGSGWDGTFNGKPMPTNDYWFKVKYKIKGQEYLFRSHFTLKR